MIRVAAVDLGTNSTRLLVADVANGRVAEIARKTRVTRLGEGVDARRRLLPEPIARVRNVLSDFRRELKAAGAERTLAVATSAVRDAENGEAFLGEVEWSYGFATRLLTGDEEAALTFRGVTTGGSLEPGTLILDLGGGSTELVLGGPDGVELHDSLNIGSVRLTERFLHRDPPSPAELEDCAEAVRSLLSEGFSAETCALVHKAIGVAGTITTLAALDLGLPEYDAERVHGHRIDRAGVDRQLERLAGVPLSERRRIPSLDPDRAPVIVAGAVIVRELLDFFGLPDLEVSERDLLDGAALEAAELPAPVEGDAPPGAYTCC
jgi:exopolyphosphatase / guanosine-5'-triphosphate,3'-diphosphate pyrophosphatase